MPSNSTTNYEDRSFIIATGNPGKRREFEKLLADFLDPRWKVYDRRSFPQPLQEVEETGASFRENAVIKAMETAQATGCGVLSDDSGLEVDALGGKPGIHSARFAGESATDEENNRLLVERLRDVPAAERRARFVAVVCLALPNNRVGRALLARSGVVYDEVDSAAPRAPEELVRIGELVLIWFRGTLEGLIVDEPAGEHGFGYDPHFFVPSQGKTLAEMDGEEKNRISHRATAVRKMVEFFDSVR